MRPIIAILVIAALISNVAVLEAFAQTRPDGFFFEEFLSGSLYMVVGGALGGIAGSAAGSLFTSSSGYSWGIDFSPLGAIPYVLGGLAIGMPIGATVGVAIVGAQVGIKGSWELSLALATLGLSGAVYGIIELGQSIQFFSLPFLLLCPIGATIGYNLGAVMLDDSSSPATQTWQFDVPVLQMSF